jgi:putative cofactor-binding repeat protein/predicted outer membrane repeat protein
VFSVDPRTGQPSDIDVTLEGMTITGGTGPQCAPTQPPCNQNGGGISIAFSVVTVKDSVITGNTTTGNGGGASFVFGALTLKNCVVSGNRADAYPGRPAGQLFGGGGLRGAGSPNVMTVIDSEITGNSSGRQGGGIFSLSPVGSPGTLIVKNSIVENNTATADPFGGGIYSNNTTLTLKDSKIAGNTPDDIAIAP